MANTYTIAATGVSFAANKSMIGIFNGSGSGQVIRVYRIWLLNNQTVAVTGVMTNIELRRLTAGSGGNAITPTKHATANPSLPAQIITASAMTVTESDLLRRFIWSTDEPVANATATIDELETLPVFGTIWDAGYADANVEPLVLREGQGISVKNIGATVGIVDAFIEFTSGAS